MKKVKKVLATALACSIAALSIPTAFVSAAASTSFHVELFAANTYEVNGNSIVASSATANENWDEYLVDSDNVAIQKSAGWKGTNGKTASNHDTYHALYAIPNEGGVSSPGGYAIFELPVKDGEWIESLKLTFNGRFCNGLYVSFSVSNELGGEYTPVWTTDEDHSGTDYTVDLSETAATWTSVFVKVTFPSTNCVDWSALFNIRALGTTVPEGTSVTATEEFHPSKDYSVYFSNPTSGANADNISYIDLGVTWAELDIVDTFTLEAWVQSDYSSEMRIIDNYNKQGVGLMLGGAYGIKAWCEGTKGIVTDVSVSNTNLKTPNEWQHMALVVDGTAKTISVYINGGKAWGPKAWAVQDGSKTFHESTATIKIAVRGDLATSKRLNGRVSDVRIWNDARSDIEIESNYTKRMDGNEENLVGYWMLNERSGNIAYDKTANKNHGTIYNAEHVIPDTTPENTHPTRDTAILFTNKTSNKEANAENLSYIDLGVTWADLDVTESVTIEAWIKSEYKSQMYFFSDWSQSTGGIGFFMAGEYGIGGMAYAGSTKIIQSNVSQTSLKTMYEWQHMALVFDADTKTLNFFINGKRAKDGIAWEAEGDFLSGTNTIKIGLRGDLNNYYRYNGMISDVRVWNDVRTDAEIENNKDTRLKGNEENLVGYWMLNERFGNTAFDMTANQNHGTIYNVERITNDGPTGIVIEQGDKLETQAPFYGESLSATLEPATANQLYDIVWSSSDESIVSINEEGVLHTKKAGTATITATSSDGGVSDTIELTITDYQPVTDFDYSFLIVPDTQNACTSYPDVLQATTDWIKANRESEKIKFMVHLGDWTNFNADSEWIKNQKTFGTILNLTYFGLIGNHDYPDISDVRDSTKINTYFPLSLQEAMPTFGGAFEEGKVDNVYHEFNVGGVPYLIIGLEFGPRDEVLTWADKVVADHPNHRTIIATHGYLWKNGMLDPGTNCWPSHYGMSSQEGNTVNDATDMWNKLIKKHANICMVLCGHMSGENITNFPETGDHGNRIQQFLIDPQDYEKSGIGIVTLMKFNEEKGTVSFEYYSTYKQAYFRERNQFTIDLPEEFSNYTTTEPDYDAYLPKNGTVQNVLDVDFEDGTFGENATAENVYIRRLDSNYANKVATPSEKSKLGIITWEVAQDNNQAIGDMVIKFSGRAIMGTEMKLYISKDDGATWQEIGQNTEDSSEPVQQIKVNGVTENKVLLKVEMDSKGSDPDTWASLDQISVDINTAEYMAVEGAEDLINAIGTVTKDSAEAIEAARDAYDALTDELKAIVENIDTLTAAEKAYADIQAEIAADKAAAEAVDGKINAIGTVTKDSAEAIEAARDAYDALTDAQKAYVTKLDTLTAAEKAYADIQAEIAADKAAAEAVDGKINAIGTVTKDSAEAIEAARDAYDALTDAQKAYVTKLDTLTAAEKAYADIQAEIAADKAAAEAVDGKINAIGTVTKDSAEAIEAARDAYDALTDAQKAYVTKLDTLTAAEKAYADIQAEIAADKAAAEAVDSKINAIGTVTKDSAEAIEAARDAYDALTDAQKGYVTKLDTLTAAEKAYADIQAEIAADKAAAEAVDGKINAIGTVTKDSAEAIEAARDAYDALTDAQKAYVTKLDTLTAAEDDYQAILDAEGDSSDDNVDDGNTGNEGDDSNDDETNKDDNADKDDKEEDNVETGVATFSIAALIALLLASIAMFVFKKRITVR